METPLYLLVSCPPTSKYFVQGPRQTDRLRAVQGVDFRRDLCDPHFLRNDRVHGPRDPDQEWTREGSRLVVTRGPHVRHAVRIATLHSRKQKENDREDSQGQA